MIPDHVKNIAFDFSAQCGEGFVNANPTTASQYHLDAVLTHEPTTRFYCEVSALALWVFDVDEALKITTMTCGAAALLVTRQDLASRTWTVSVDPSWFGVDGAGIMGVSASWHLASKLFPFLRDWRYELR